MTATFTSDFKSDYFYKTNPSFTATNHVIEFSKPLSKINIDYFTMDRHYFDGSRLVMTNSMSWIKHYWQKELFKFAVFEHNPLSFSTGHVFWNWLKREPIYSAAAEFGIDNGVTLSEKNDLYCDFFHFGSIGNNSLNNDKINSFLHLLWQFCAKFKNKLCDLIRNAEKNRIIVPKTNNSSVPSDKIKNDLLIDDFLLLLEKREVSRIYLSDELENKYLTRSEFLLLRELVIGKSCFEAAENLGIAKDTVNKRIRNIKDRLECNSLCQLGFLIGKLSTRNIFPFKISQGITDEIMA